MAPPAKSVHSYGRRKQSPQVRRYTLLGRGTNGAVLKGPKDLVYKWTVDPVEIQAWMATVALRNRGMELDGMPHVADIRIGDREAVIVREDLAPLRGQRSYSTLDPASRSQLQHANRLITAGRMTRNRFFYRRGLAQQKAALRGHPLLRPLGAAAYNLVQWGGAVVPDIRPENIGMGARGLAILDPGRTPAETSLVSRGEAEQRCANEAALRSAVAHVLGRAPSYKSCRVVGARGLSKVMKTHGWTNREIDGTAGFHTNDGRILIRNGDEWSTLHEMVHAAGVVDASIASWLAEGLTEAAAQDVSAAKGWKHTPTYPTEVRVVRQRLVPALGVTVTDLASNVAKDPRGAGRRIAVGLQRAKGGTVKGWQKHIGRASVDSRGFVHYLRKAR